jgi:hypothetical protein
MDDKAKVTELQINVVMLDRRKMLIRLNQNGMWTGRVLVLHSSRTLLHRRNMQRLNHPMVIA